MCEYDPYPTHSTTNRYFWVLATIAVQDAALNAHLNIAIILLLTKQEIVTRVHAILDTTIMGTSCTTILLGDVTYNAIITIIPCHIRIYRQGNARHSVPLTIIKIVLQ